MERTGRSWGTRPGEACPETGLDAQPWAFSGDKKEARQSRAGQLRNAEETQEVQVKVLGGPGMTGRGGTHFLWSDGAVWGVAVLESGCGPRRWGRDGLGKTERWVLI